MGNTTGGSVTGGSKSAYGGLVEEQGRPGWKDLANAAATAVGTAVGVAGAAMMKGGAAQAAGGGFFGGDEAADPAKSLREYERSFAARAKERAIRGVARALVEVGVKVDPEAEPDVVVQQLVALLPSPANGRAFKNDADTHKKLCESIAAVLNKEFTPHASKPADMLIDPSGSPASICRAVSEWSHSFAAGVNTEFLAVHASVRNLLQTLAVLDPVVEGIYAKIRKGIEADGEREALRELAPLDEVFRRALKERERLMLTLRNMLQVQLAPAAQELEIAMRDESEQNALIKSLKLQPGTAEFSQTLGYALSGLGTAASVASRVHKALKAAGLSVREYLSSADFAALESRLDKKFLSGVVGPKDAAKFIEAQRLLRDAFTEQKNETFRRVLESDAIEGEPAFVGAAEEKSKLLRGLERASKAKQVVVADFVGRLQRQYAEMLRAIDELAPKLGLSVPLGPETDAVNEAIMRLGQSHESERLEFALIGLYLDAKARTLKEKFISELKLVSNACSRVAGGLFDRLKTAADGVVKIIELFTGIIAAQRVEPVVRDALGGEAGSEDEEEQAFLPSVATSGLTLKEAVNAFRYAYYLARVRENLSRSAKELVEFGADYDALMGAAVAEVLTGLEKKRVVENIAIATDKSIKDAPRARKWVDARCNAKRNLWRAVQAIDLYLKAFALNAAKDPEALRGLVRELDGVQVIARWFNDTTGDSLYRSLEESRESGSNLREIDEHYYARCCDNEGVIMHAERPDGSDAFSLTRAETVRNSVDECIDSFQALKNLINAFARIGDEFGGAEIHSKVFMSPSQIYRALTLYLKNSAFSEDLITASMLKVGGDEQTIAPSIILMLKVAAFKDTQAALEAIPISFTEDTFLETLRPLIRFIGSLGDSQLVLRKAIESYVYLANDYLQTKSRTPNPGHTLTPKAVERVYIENIERAQVQLIGFALIVLLAELSKDEKADKVSGNSRILMEGLVDILKLELDAQLERTSIKLKGGGVSTPKEILSRALTAGLTANTPDAFTSFKGMLRVNLMNLRLLMIPKTWFDDLTSFTLEAIDALARPRQASFDLANNSSAGSSTSPPTWVVPSVTAVPKQAVNTTQTTHPDPTAAIISSARSSSSNPTTTESLDSTNTNLVLGTINPTTPGLTPAANSSARSSSSTPMGAVAATSPDLAAKNNTSIQTNHSAPPDDDSDPTPNYIKWVVDTVLKALPSGNMAELAVHSYRTIAGNLPGGADSDLLNLMLLTALSMYVEYTKLDQHVDMPRNVFLYEFLHLGAEGGDSQTTLMRLVQFLMSISEEDSNKQLASLIDYPDTLSIGSSSLIVGLLFERIATASAIDSNDVENLLNAVIDGSTDRVAALGAALGAIQNHYGTLPSSGDIVTDEGQFREMMFETSTEGPALRRVQAMIPTITGSASLMTMATMFVWYFIAKNWGRASTKDELTKEFPSFLAQVLPGIDDAGVALAKRRFERVFDGCSQIVPRPPRPNSAGWVTVLPNFEKLSFSYYAVVDEMQTTTPRAAQTKTPTLHTGQAMGANNRTGTSYSGPSQLSLPPSYPRSRSTSSIIQSSDMVVDEPPPNQTAHLRNRSEKCLEDSFFTAAIRAMAGKVMACVGAYDMLERKAPLASLTPIRVILGGWSGVVPTVNPDAAELYFRLPRLAEYYQNLFEWGGKNKEQESSIALVPEMGGIFTGLIQFIYTREGRGEYTDAEAYDLITEINTIHSAFAAHKSGACRAALEAFVCEVNRRYGVVKKEDWQAYQKRLNEERGGRTQTRNNTNYQILPDEDEGLSVIERRAPSDRFTRGYTRYDPETAQALDPRTGRPTAEKPAFDLHAAASAETIPIGMRLVNEFHKNIEKSLRQPATQRKQGKIQFRTLIHDAAEKMRSASKPAEQLLIAVGLIQDAREVHVEEGKALMLHESVITGLNVLSGMYDLLKGFDEIITPMARVADHDAIVEIFSMSKSRKIVQAIFEGADTNRILDSLSSAGVSKHTAGILSMGYSSYRSGGGEGPWRPTLAELQWRAAMVLDLSKWMDGAKDDPNALAYIIEVVGLELNGRHRGLVLVNGVVEMDDHEYPSQNVARSSNSRERSVALKALACDIAMGQDPTFRPTPTYLAARLVGLGVESRAMATNCLAYLTPDRDDQYFHSKGGLPDKYTSKDLYDLAKAWGDDQLQKRVLEDVPMSWCCNFFARFSVNHDRIMVEMLENVFDLAGGSQSLVDVRFTDSKSITINFSRLRGAGEDLLEGVKWFAEALRPHVDDSIMKLIEGAPSAPSPGSIAFFEDRLVDGYFRGAHTGEVAQRQKRTLEGLARKTKSTLGGLLLRFLANGARSDPDEEITAENLYRGRGLEDDALITNSYWRPLCQLVYYEPIGPTKALGRLYSQKEGKNNLIGLKSLWYSSAAQFLAVPGDPPVDEVYRLPIFAVGPTWTPFRSLMFMLNQILAKFLETFLDSGMEGTKIYAPLINAFANGVMNVPVLDPQQGFPDLSGTQRPIYYYAFGDPTPNALLLQSLALACQTITRSVNEKSANPIPKHLVNSLIDIPLYMKERYRAELPGFIRLFRLLGQKCDYLKSFIQKTDPNLTRGGVPEPYYLDGSRDPVEARYYGKIAASVVSEDEGGENELRAVEFSEDTVKGLSMLGEMGKSKEEMAALLSRLASTISDGAYALGTSAADVLKELADTPQYFQTGEDSVERYIQRNGKSPLMPLSLALWPLSQKAEVDASNGWPGAGVIDQDIVGAFGASAPYSGVGLGTDTRLIPLCPFGGSAFKFLYGTRQLLASDDPVGSCQIPGAQALLTAYNASAASQDRIDAQRYGQLVYSVVTILRCLYGARNFKPILSTRPVFASTAFQTVANMDPTLKSFTARPEGQSVENVIDVVESTDQEGSIFKITNLLRHVTASNIPKREQECVDNLVDMNIMPINVHALMRDVPLVNIYNFDMAFCQLSRHLFALRGADERQPSDAASRILFCGLLAEPYKIITNEEFGRPTRGEGGDRLVRTHFSPLRRIFRGDNSLGLGRPKFLSDQLYGKSLFGSLYFGDKSPDDHPGMLGLDPNFVTLTYLQVKNDEDAVVVKSVRVDDWYALNDVARRRFDLILIRNLFFITNTVRTLRLALNRELTQSRNVVRTSHLAVASGVTEYGIDPFHPDEAWESKIRGTVERFSADSVDI